MNNETAEDPKRAKAFKLLFEYEQAVVLQLVEDIIKHEADFLDTATPLHGSVPGILKKYYGVLNSIFVARRAINKEHCGS